MKRRLVTAAAVAGPEGIRGNGVLIAGSTVEAVGVSGLLQAPGIPENAFPDGWIIPGLIDAHLHPVSYAGYLGSAGFKSARDLADVLDRVSDAARDLPPGVPVTGMRLDDESLAERRLPTRFDLDRTTPDRPVLLHRYCGHIAIANTAALDLAGIGPGTSDPPGGTFDRDAAGAPTGVLRETAIQAVATAIAHAAPAPVGTVRLGGVLGALAGTELTAIGAIAGMGGGPWAVFGNEVDALAAVAATTPIRIGVFVAASDPTRLAAAADLLDTAGPRVEFLGVKIFADGSLGGHTAAMYEPFTDRPDAVGTLRLDPKRDRALAEAALEHGSRVAIHAIGDRAVGAVLDLFADLITAGANYRMLRIEHASVLAPGDVARFAELGIAAVVQPAFLTSEAGWLEARVGTRRLRGTYPFRTLLDAGVTLAGSSDCPVEPPFPLHGIAAARDRSGVVPAEGLDAGQALGLFTTGAARVAGWPEPLVPGSPADFTVIDQDPLTAAPDDLRKARILATWVDGAPVPVPPDVAPWKE